MAQPPAFIRDTPGASFFSLEAEDIPLAKRVFLPRSALLRLSTRWWSSGLVPLLTASASIIAVSALWSAGCTADLDLSILATHLVGRGGHGGGSS
jgi:hypothetical protein